MLFEKINDRESTLENIEKEKKEKIYPPILLFTFSLKLRSKEHLEKKLSFLKNQYRYNL